MNLHIQSKDQTLGSVHVVQALCELSSVPQSNYLTSHVMLPAGCTKQFVPVVSKKVNLRSQKLKSNTARYVYYKMFLITLYSA